MVVSSKYNMGDKVWFISDNKVLCLEITGIGMIAHLTGSEITYTLHYDKEIGEDKVYPSKEELLKSL